MAQDNFLEDDQFVISHELLHVLHWILKYESENLSQLIMSSFLKGIEEKTKNNDMLDQMKLTDEMQNSIVDFFGFLEQQIAEVSDQESSKHIMNKKVLQTIDHIDPKRFDYETIKSTVLATAEKVDPSKDTTQAQEQFLKELLRQWKPKKEKNKKFIMN